MMVAAFVALKRLKKKKLLVERSDRDRVWYHSKVCRAKNHIHVPIARSEMCGGQLVQDIHYIFLV